MVGAGADGIDTSEQETRRPWSPPRVTTVADLSEALATGTLGTDGGTQT